MSNEEIVKRLLFCTKDFRWRLLVLQHKGVKSAVKEVIDYFKNAKNKT